MFRHVEEMRQVRMRCLKNMLARQSLGNGFALTVMGLCFGLAILFDRLIPNISLLLIFISGVLLTALRASIAAVLLSIVLSALIYNFFFTEPHYTFFMNRREDVSAVLFFMFFAMIGGKLVSYSRDQFMALRVSNSQAQEVAAFSRSLLAATDSEAVYREISTTLHRLTGVNVMILIRSAANDDVLHLESTESLQCVKVHPEYALPGEDVYKVAADVWSQAKDDCMPVIIGSDWCFMMLGLQEDRLGLVGLRSHAGLSEQFSFLQLLVTHASLALLRIRFAQRLEEARLAEETERLRSAVLSSISHDLRTPLASMIGAASAVRTLDGTLSLVERTELLDSVLSEGERLDRYIQNLLDMTRISYGPLNLIRDWISVSDIVNSAVRRTRNLFSECNMKRSVPDSLPMLYVHPALIEQALVNVLENAAKFSPAGGTVIIEAGCVESKLRLAVIDEGPGIPEKQRSRVFDMFFTGVGGDHDKHGSGLGLAICAGMVGAHGGRVEATPGRGGDGTAIIMWLPIVSPPDNFS